MIIGGHVCQRTTVPLPYRLHRLLLLLCTMIFPVCIIILPGTTRSWLLSRVPNYKLYLQRQVEESGTKKTRRHVKRQSGTDIEHCLHGLHFTVQDCRGMVDNYNADLCMEPVPNYCLCQLQVFMKYYHSSSKSKRVVELSGTSSQDDFVPEKN